MDNDPIPKDRQKNILSKLKPIEVLDAKEKPHQEVTGKQPTQNSDNLQNQFDLPSFKCEVCPYESIWKHAVKRHQQTHYRGQNISEGNKKSKYKCESCSYTTNNWTILKDHQKLHSIPKRKVGIDVVAINPSSPLKRSKVEQKNKQAEEGKNNEDQELNKINIFTCKKCQYRTSYQVVFENHQKIHLPNKGDEIFRCDLCSFSSIYRQSFVRHMKKMHENELGNEDSVLQCFDCGITSTCDDELQEHIKMHEEMKNAEEKLDHNGKKNISFNQQDTDLHRDKIHDLESHNNNLPHRERSDSLRNKFPDPALRTPQSQKFIAKTRRGKYSDVPVKTTKNGLFECEHCSYQTAIRTALVKHQTNHLKTAKS